MFSDTKISAKMVYQLERYVNSFAGSKKPLTAYGPSGNSAKAPAAADDDDDDDDDDVDLFGSEDEEEAAAAAKIREERLAAYAAKKSKSNC